MSTDAVVMGSEEGLEGRDGNNGDDARESEWAAYEWFAGFQTHTLSGHFTVAFFFPRQQAVSFPMSLCKNKSLINSLCNLPYVLIKSLTPAIKLVFFLFLLI